MTFQGLIFQDYVFYALAAILLFAGLRVITARNPVHAALFLVLAFFTAAGIWLMLGAEFLAITLVLVYVGAVMVLFLFVVMMLDINLEKMREGFWDAIVPGTIVGGLICAEMIMILGTRHYGVDRVTAPPPQEAGYSNTAEIGRQLYTDYLLPFELAAVVLLVAIVAAIALALRDTKKTRFMGPGEQVRVKKADRLRMVKMESFKEPLDSASPETTDSKPGEQKPGTGEPR